MRRVLSVMILALVMMLAPGLASAQGSPDSSSGDAGNDAFQSRIVVKNQKKKREFNDKIVVVQRKPVIRRGRAELVPTFFGSVSDPLVFQLGAAVQFNYHILEQLYVGLYAGWQDWRVIDSESNGLSSAYDDVVDATDAVATTSIVDAFAGVMVGYVPVEGKFAAFNSGIVHWDFSVGIGGGVVNTRTNGISPGGLISFDHRWYLLKWLSLNVGLKGWIYYDDTHSHSGVYTHWQAGLGVGFWLPPSWSYRTDW